MTYAIGVDVGGTKVATVLSDSKCNVHHRIEMRSNPEDDEKMFEVVLLSISKVLKGKDISIDEVSGIGLGVPGKIDREKGIAIFQNNLPWRNFPIVKRLKEHFPTLNIKIENDVYMAAYAESKVANTKFDDIFVYFTISTGISCSIIHKNSFLRGNGFAGEIGLLPVKSKFSETGIDNLEKSASGPVIAKLARNELGVVDMTSEKFFHEYKKGNKEVMELMDEIVKTLSHGLYSIICLLDPNKIVIGGGVMNNNPFLLELIKDSLKGYLIPEQAHALYSLETSKLKSNSGVIGASLFVMDHTNNMEGGNKSINF